MSKSILEAIKSGHWNFEPSDTTADAFSPADAMPGSEAKLRILAERIRTGLPLWHPRDRNDLEAPSPSSKIR